MTGDNDVMHRRLTAAAIVVMLAVPLHQTADAQRGGGAAGRGGPGGRGGAEGRGGVEGRGRAADAGAGGGAQAQRAERARQGRPEASGTATIRGRVQSLDTGQPVRRAQVRATANGAGGLRLVTSDADGGYELKDLPAGRWTVSVSKAGFITQQYGQRRPSEPTDPIELADGQKFAANFSLSRGSVLTGQVFDEFGDPITGARVQVMRAQMRQGRRQLVTVATADQTDDRGLYRIYGLAPGDYYLAGSLRVAPIESTEGAVTYAPTYYPGTGTVAEAQRLTLGAGEEQTGINFVLLPVRAVRVSGTVTGSTGEPTAATLTLVSDADAGGPTTSSAGRADASGAFTISNVVPGSYQLVVNGRRGNQPTGPGRLLVSEAPGTAIEVASVPIVVGDDDVTGVAVVTSTGASVKGSVSFDGTSKPPQAQLRVVAQPLGSGPSPAMPAQVSANGSFEMTGLLGPYLLRVNPVPEGWMIASVTANGADASDSAIDFRATDQVAVRIALTNKVTEISGTVRAGTQPSQATVVIFPDDEAKWPFPSRHVQVARAGKNGAYSIRALPPGERYLAVAVDYLEQGEQQDPAFLERIKARATSLTLGDGEKKTLDLRLAGR